MSLKITGSTLAMTVDGYNEGASISNDVGEKTANRQQWERKVSGDFMSEPRISIQDRQRETERHKGKKESEKKERERQREKD